MVIQLGHFHLTRSIVTNLLRIKSFTPCLWHIPRTLLRLDDKAREALWNKFPLRFSPYHLSIHGGRQCLTVSRVFTKK